MSDPSASPTSSAAESTQTSDSGKSGPTSSPLLFFVALGFGVVFTNLWIIVGVKYCFRYNQRNRQMRAVNENGEPIDLAAMPRPHRRRREKKLMSMEEVNERFPLAKYKTWRSSREARGLPAEGGVTAPPSRAGSAESGSDPPHPVATTSRASEEKHGEEATTIERTETAATANEKDRRNSLAEDEDDDDPIRTAAPPEMLGAPGDSCAICLDTLEDDDDVRGLTCGHAFHGACVDPWLTSRRACCPLCKADYYVPKPRPEGEEQNSSGRRSGRGANMPQNPPPAWIGSRGMPFRSRFLGSRGLFLSSNQPQDPNLQQYQSSSVSHRERMRRNQDAADFVLSPRNRSTASNNASPSWRSRLPTLRVPGFGQRRNQQQQSEGEHGTPEVVGTSPADLEAGHAGTQR
ncbi:hypothetical protein Q7P37_001572 [Cladosporium fusiforme]